MSKSDGGPAFGSFYVDGSCKIPPDLHGFSIRNEPGMSLRDWLAGMAMQGFLAGTRTEDVPSDAADRFIRNVGVASYVAADAMLEERAR